jgi:hypothetical protein
MGTYYKNVEQYLDRIDTGVWVEIGVERGEGSTRWFATQAASRNVVHFYAVDAMQDQVDHCIKLIKEHEFAKKTTVVHAKGEAFAENLQKTIGQEKISLVYLDNFDWDYWLGQQEEPFVPAQKAKYLDELSIEMNNFHSQLTHLAQAINLHTMLADNCLVICDDTWYEPNQGVFIGKCSAAIPFLMLLSNMKILHCSGYRQNSGVILGRFND